MLDAEKAREQAERKAAMATAEKEANEDPVRRVHDLRVSLGKGLTVESLREQVKSQQKQIDQLEAKQENAYEKVQNIANRAVDSARREIVAIPTGAGKNKDGGSEAD